MQTPLYEEFYNSMNAAILPVVNENKENLLNNPNLLPPKSKSPNRLFRKRLSSAVDVSYISSPGNKSERHSNIGGANDHNPLECRSPQNGQLKENNLDSQKEAMSPRFVLNIMIITSFFQSRRLFICVYQYEVETYIIYL